MQKTTIQILLILVLIVYMLLLTKYILITRINSNPRSYVQPSHISGSIKYGLRKANFKPFATIKLMWRGRNMTAWERIKNLAGNVLGFVPMGILLPLIFRKLNSFIGITVLVFLISLTYECIQLTTGLGQFDVDDLILNTAGGMIGYVIHYLASLVYRQPAATRGSALQNG